MVMVFAIGVGESQSACEAWIEKHDLTYPVLSDANGTVWNQYGMGYVPHNTVIDDTLIVQYTWYGYYENTIRGIINTYSPPLVKIKHDSLSNTENVSTDYTVDAEIRSGGNLIGSSLKVYWNTDGGSTFTAVDMVSSGGDDYTCDIPAQSAGTTVYYYIHAESDNGKEANNPLTAPDRPHEFMVLVDTFPPVITHTPYSRWLAPEFSPLMMADVTDELSVATVELLWEVNGGSTQTAAMAETKPGHWEGEFTGTVVTGDVVTYRIQATDSSVAQNTAFHPASGSHTMTMTDPIPALVLDYDGNTNSGPVIRDTLIGLGLATEYYTEIPPLLKLYESVWVCMGVGNDSGMIGNAASDDLVAYIEGHGKVYLEGGNFWNDDDPRPSVWFKFGIGGTGGGSGDTGPVVGAAGEIADGLNFAYTGDNASMDTLKLKSPESAELFRNGDPDYLNGVIRRNADYTTVGLSFEMGGLVDGTGYSTKDYLVALIADEFGLDVTLPTPPPAPTATPTPPPTCDTLGAELYMPGTDFGPGDMVSCTVTVCNPGPDTYTDVPLFVILDVYGSYFFWPSFNTTFDNMPIDLDVGTADYVVLPEFPWPANAGNATGVMFYAAMTDSGYTGLFGELGMWTFGWHQ